MQKNQDNSENSVDAWLIVLDRGTFWNLVSILGLPRVMQLVALFFADAERRLSLLEGEGSTASDLQEHAHALVSMAGHLGLTQLSALCLELQERVPGNEWWKASSAIRTSLASAREAMCDEVAKRSALMAPTSRAPNREALIIN